jgi:hypothetical protein
MHVYPDATADVATTPTLAAVVGDSTKSSGTKRRRSEAEILEEWNMEMKAYYNQPTLPKFEILKTDFRYPNPFRGEHTEDCKTKDPDYSPELEL